MCVCVQVCMYSSVYECLDAYAGRQVGRHVGRHYDILSRFIEHIYIYIDIPDIRMH